MEITLKIPDELAAQARARGLKLEVYIQEILAQQLGIPSGTGQPRAAGDSRLAGFTRAVLR